MILNKTSIILIRKTLKDLSIWWVNQYEITKVSLVNHRFIMKTLVNEQSDRKLFYCTTVRHFCEWAYRKVEQKETYDQLKSALSIVPLSLTKRSYAAWKEMTKVQDRMTWQQSSSTWSSDRMVKWSNDRVFEWSSAWMICSTHQKVESLNNISDQRFQL